MDFWWVWWIWWVRKGDELVVGMVDQWIVGVISFQKIFGLYGLKGHKVEKR